MHPSDTMPDPTSPSPVSSRSLACGLLVPLVWFLRKPLLGLVALVLRTALALVLPTLMALGILKAWQMISSETEIPKDADPPYPGDAESLTAPAAEVASPTGVI